MIRPRKHDKHLPPCVYLRRGAYYYVRRGKWIPLGKREPEALAQYARLREGSGGGMAALIDDALPVITRDVSASTAKQYRREAMKLRKVLAEYAPHEVTPRDVAQIRREASARSVAVANRMLTVLRLVFAYALEEQLVDANPCVGIKRAHQPARTRRLTLGEYAAIRAAASDRLRVVMDLCALTGQRIGDVLSIKRSDCGQDGIAVQQQKTRARLVIAWTDELREAVEAAKALHGPVAGLYLVKGTRGQLGRPLAYKVIWSDWRAACKAAGVVDANIHDMRAMAATEAQAQGVDPQALLGHADAKMTRRYLRDRTVPVVEPPRLKGRR